MGITTPQSIEDRTEYTTRRLDEFRAELRKGLTEEEIEYALGGEGCVYVTGSGGRGEMHGQSDLDTFIVYRDPPGGELENPRLRAMLLQAAVIRASRACKLPDPSRDGEFLAPHRAADLIKLLGSPADDMENKLTARMLLLLESRSLLGEPVYTQVIRDVMERYWETSGDHASDFLPYMLANDIIRYWRIILLNHEAKLSRKKEELEKSVAEPKAVELKMKHHRKYNSYKMRFARCLTCFSTLADMLARTNATGNLRLDDALAMVCSTPLDRLKSVASIRPETLDRVQGLVDLYAKFLETSEAGEQKIIERLANDPEFGTRLSNESRDFPTEMLELMLSLRNSETNESLFRHMVI